MLEPQLKTDVQAIVYAPRWLVRVPVALQQAYAAQVVHRFAWHVRFGSPLLLTLYVACNIFTFFLYRDRVVGADALRWWYADGFIGAVIVGGLTLARFKAAQHHFAWWVPIMLALILGAGVQGAILTTDPVLSRNVIYVVLVILIVGLLALALPPLSGLAGSVLGAFGFAAAARSHDPDFAFAFFCYYVLTTLVCMLTGFLREMQDRLSFLQSVLLEAETREVQRLNGELARLARLDGLSGLANRRSFDEALLREWDRARRQGQSLALLMLDVDHFKRFNDTYGHPAGDDCLTQISRILAREMRRPGDLAARYGGEEFAVLLPGNDVTGGREVAQRIVDGIDALAIPHDNSDTARHVTVSIGVAALRPGATGMASQLVDAADAALYEAKHSGRHRVVAGGGTAAA